MRPFEITRSGVIGTIAVFVAAAVCVRLGIWQLDRRSQRLERNAVIAERMQGGERTLDAIPGDTAGWTYRRVVVQGQYDDARSIVLAGRSRAGSPGVHVYTPIRLGRGALLVNRGWLPSRDAATVDLEGIRNPGPARVEGILVPFPDVHLEPPDHFQTTWFRLDGDAIRRQYPYPIASLYLQRIPSRAGAARADTTSLPVALEPPTLSSGPHLSYAIQWFSFATIFIVGWAVLVARQTEGTPDRGERPDDPR